MTNDYNIKILTNKDLGDPDFVRNLMNTWYYGLDSKLKPEFFGLGEPVRHSFAEKGLEVAVKSWIKEGMGLLLRRRGQFGYSATIDWWRRDKKLDERLFPWSCTVYLRRKSGDGLALKYFKFLIEWFEPAFGFLSTNKQVDDKHFVTFEDSTGTTETYEGLDILEKEERLPGIYWATYFGPWAVKKIRKAQFLNLQAERIDYLNGGYLVVAYGSSAEIGTSSAHKAENKIIDKSGRKHFFDKTLADIESLKTDAKEAEIIEKKIEELKVKKAAKKG